MKYEEFATLANRYGYKINHHSTMHMGWPDGESIEGHDIERHIDGENGAGIRDDPGQLYIGGKKSTIEDLENYFRSNNQKKRRTNDH
jgi:hypothetical protein